MATKKVQKVTKTPLFKKKKVIIGIISAIVAFIVVVVLFGSPSAKTVFNDMQETMLQTKSVTLDETYAMSGTEEGTFQLKSVASIDLSDITNPKTKGNFTMNLTSSGVPMTIGADYVGIDSGKYVRFSKLSSSDADTSATLDLIAGKVKDTWIKTKDTDTFTSLASVPFSTLTSVLPTPFANLDTSQRKVVLDILRDKSTYTIEESSKVEISGTSAYKYSIKYNKDQYKKFEKSIAGYNKFFEVGSDSDSQIKTLNVWVNIRTKQIIKLEFSGTSKDGSIEGTVLFSDYNKKVDISKPNDYSIESELIQ